MICVSTGGTEKERFTPKGLNVEYAGSTKFAHKHRKGLCQLVYISPESLLIKLERAILICIKKNLVAVVIDEAHCIKKW